MKTKKEIKKLKKKISDLEYNISQIYNSYANNLNKMQHCSCEPHLIIDNECQKCGKIHE